MSVRDRLASEAEFPPADETEEDFLSTLEMDGDLEIDRPTESETSPFSDVKNPNEANVPPYPTEVPATRLSDFRCGGRPVEYPAPNGLAPENISFTLHDKCDPYPSNCGGLNDLVKKKFDVLFSDVKLEALFTGIVDSARTSYKSAWAGLVRFCFVRGISAWPIPGTPEWDEPLSHYLIWTRGILGRKASTLKGRFAAIRFTRLVDGMSTSVFRPTGHVP